MTTTGRPAQPPVLMALWVNENKASLVPHTGKTLLSGVTLSGAKSKRFISQLQIVVLSSKVPLVVGYFSISSIELARTSLTNDGAGCLGSPIDSDIWFKSEGGKICFLSALNRSKGYA